MSNTTWRNKTTRASKSSHALWENRRKTWITCVANEALSLYFTLYLRRRRTKASSFGWLASHIHLHRYTYAGGFWHYMRGLVGLAVCVKLGYNFRLRFAFDRCDFGPFSLPTCLQKATKILQNGVPNWILFRYNCSSSCLFLNVPNEPHILEGVKKPMLVAFGVTRQVR